LIYTLHRFAVTAAGQRLAFNRKVLSETLEEAMIDSFRAIIDLDDGGRRQVGRKVLEKMKLANPGCYTRKRSSLSRLRPSMR